MTNRVAAHMTPYKPRIKFCRITSESVLHEMSSLKVDFAGFHAINSLNTTRLQEISLLKNVLMRTHSTVIPVLLTKVTDIHQIIDAILVTNISWLQLHCPWTPENLSTLRELHRRANINLTLIQLIEPQSARDMGYVKEVLSVCEYIILDQREGGTGRRVPNDVVRCVVGAVGGQRVFLAGGLDSSNVATVVRDFRPYAVDVQSGILRSDGIQDLAKMKAFVSAVASGAT